MKVLALYLPQYHRVKENDEWWGEGFTDWVAVKNAKVLYENHQQPKVPYKKKYYDLLEKATWQNQAKAIQMSGIDGICIYHYWFKNGRQILEKPAEKLLEWKDVDIPFCFSWANETWARTWSGLTNKNTWSSEFENKNNTNESGILLEQKYGTKEDWKMHFEYLLQFFVDERYIKIESRPVIVIHKTRDMHCFENMVDYWNSLAIENGFNGLYVIANEPRKSQIELASEVMMCEPAEAMHRSNYCVRNGVRCYEYDEIWTAILSQNVRANVSIGGFVGYDDTPRHGYAGSVIENATPDKFKKYMTMLIQKNRMNNVEVMFINAWNEWGEGMYLEADEYNQNNYIINLKNSITDEDCKYFLPETINNVYLEKYEEICYWNERNNHIVAILDRWLELREKNVDIFKNLKNKRIVIYGYGILGKHLVQELIENDIEIAFIVDRNKEVTKRYHVLGIEEEWLPFDVVIVSATFDYGYIYKKIRTKYVDAEILSLEHLIMEM